MSSKFHYIGFSLAPNSSHTSSVCVIDKNKEIVLLDKLYFTDDIKLFFETSPFIKNSIIFAGLCPDESLLDGKWRIHSKNYKMIDGMFAINRNNWTNRYTPRLSDMFRELNAKTCPVYRCNLNLLRMAYGLSANYPEKTSLDCKNFQIGLKIKYGFSNMPDNLLPSTSLESILCALFAYDFDKKNIKTKPIANFMGLEVLNRI